MTERTASTAHNRRELRSSHYERSAFTAAAADDDDEQGGRLAHDTSSRLRNEKERTEERNRAREQFLMEARRAALGESLGRDRFDLGRPKKKRPEKKRGAMCAESRIESKRPRREPSPPPRAYYTHWLKAPAETKGCSLPACC